MKTKEFNEIVDLFCIELEKQREFDGSTLNLINKIVNYSNNKEYTLMDFERDLDLIKNLTFVKYMLCEYSVTNIDIQLKNQIHLIKTILQNKAKEYSKDENRLHNFYLGSNLSSQNPIDVCFGYMLKHICSVYDILVEDNLIEKILPPVDVIQEKFNDLINYIILMHAVKKQEFSLDIKKFEKWKSEYSIYGTGNSIRDFNYKRNFTILNSTQEYHKKQIHYINASSDNEVEIKFKKLTETAQEPIQSTEGACGYDIFADEIEIINEFGHNISKVVYKTNIAVEIPNGYAFKVLPGSSVSKTSLRLSNAPGLIDDDYRGGIKAIFDNINHWEKEPIIYKVGERIGQLVLIHKIKSKFIQTDTLSETKRGDGGFGSTGK